MLLALLMLVVGLLGGALGGPPAALVLDTERAIGGAMPVKLSWDAALVRSGMERAGVSIGGPIGGPPMDGIEPMDGGGVPETERGMARGGGGVAVFASGTSAPGFLLTQRFRSGSYTKLLASPSLARTGLLGDISGLGDSAFLPNHPPKPHPFLPPCAPARLAIGTSVSSPRALGK